MKPHTFRLLIACSLIVLLLVSALPASFATTGRGSQSTNQASSQRRGKNGNPATAAPVKKTDTQTETKPGADDTHAAEQKKSSTGSTASSPEAGTPENTAVDDTKVPTTFEEAQPKQQGKREPLPFDRPPSGTQDSATTVKKTSPDFDRPASPSSTRNSTDDRTTQTTTTQTQQPGVRVQSPQAPPVNPAPRTTTPNSQTQRYPSNGSDSSRYPSTDSGSSRYPSSNPSSSSSENDPYSTTRTAPPVLRREKDSRNESSNNGDSRGAPPVLRRSGENSDPYPRNDGNNGNPSSSSRNYPQSGSTPSTPDDSQDETIRLGATLVNIPILVSDRSNRFVPRLTARDFLLYEDGVQQEVAFFGNEEVPFSVALLLDMSPSVQGNTQAIQDAAIDFVRQLRPDDRVMVISFDRHVDYLTDFTSDRRILERAIRSTSTGSGTSVYDAVYETVYRKLRNVDGRKALILFSDGEDTTSKSSYDDAINIVTESDVLVYGLRYPSDGGSNVRVNPWPRSPIPNIGIPLPFPWPFPRRRGGHLTGNFTGQPNVASSAMPSSQWPRRGGRGGDFMADITAAGGGPVFDADTINDMRGLANKIAEELRHVYQISYYPTNSLMNGGYRTIRIRVKNRDDIAVRHRKGYNAREVAKGGKI